MPANLSLSTLMQFPLTLNLEIGTELSSVGESDSHLTGFFTVTFNCRGGKFKINSIYLRYVHSNKIFNTLQDYQRAFGTRCAACNQYVEGEVVSALGNTYHQKCFTCARCKSVHV